MHCRAVSHRADGTPRVLSSALPATESRWISDRVLTLPSLAPLGAELRPFPHTLEASQIALSSPSPGRYVPSLTALHLPPPLTHVHTSARSITSDPDTTLAALSQPRRPGARPGTLSPDTPAPERGTPAATARSPHTRRPPTPLLR